ncbi:MAG: sigma-70 family RNA polymerase sigma factor [Rickettsiales bacterium]|nr:sigma-70 family RNA polymerase sigma factor [Rickettsiales bacterium]
MIFKLQIELEELLAEAQKGDKAAYKNFLNKVSAYLKPKLSGKIFDLSEVDDVVQEILISIHKARHTYDFERPLLPWINSIASYRVTDYLRKYYSNRSNEKVNIDSFFDIEDENSVTNNKDDNEIDINLNVLKDKQRKVIELMYFKDMSVKEVSASLKISESDVKVTAHRAYKILRTKINNEK